MFRGGDGNAGAGAEHVVCVLRIWEDGGAAMEYVVCFWEKEEKEEENCRIREDDVASGRRAVLV